VSWQSTKQRFVAISSCEAEYVATATASYQVVWLARLLSKIMNREVERVVLKVDNKSAISIIRNPVLNDHRDTLIQDFILSESMKQMDWSLFSS
jgi:hypothetical protein